MPRRDDDDDDDDRPRRRRGRERPGVMPWLVIGGLGLGLVAIVAVGVVVFILLTRADDQPEERGPPVADRVVNPRVKAGPVDNWPRFIGTWRLADPSQAHELREVIVRPDRTATLVFYNADGRKQNHETQVAIVSQGPDTIRVQFRVPKGLYGYSFRFRDDNRLEYQMHRGVQVYERVK